MKVWGWCDCAEPLPTLEMSSRSVHFGRVDAVVILAGFQLFRWPVDTWLRMYTLEAQGGAAQRECGFLPLQLIILMIIKTNIPYQEEFFANACRWRKFFREFFYTVKILTHSRNHERTRVYNTVFIRIVAAATINFSLTWVCLLIEGGSYSRAPFINFGPILDGVIIA